MTLMTRGALAALLVLAGSTPAQAQSRWTLAAQGNEARYLVREQLVGRDLPNDAVGRTNAIEGGLVVDAAGNIVKEQSSFTIDMAALKTDSDRRDNFVRRNTLQTAQHPKAVFVPTSFRNLRFPLPASGDLAFQMLGDLTIRGVTRPVVFDVTATIANGALTGEAKTKFTFTEFEITKPRVGSVLSVDDDIRLEYSFFLIPAR